MTKTTRPTRPFVRLTILAFAGLLFLAGCSLPMGGNLGSADSTNDTKAPAAKTGAVGSVPYTPTDFRDLMVPGELEWHRDKSVSINTESFTGGILNFSGRVEVNSLTEFFINGMKKDGWTSIGSVKSENVLLAFINDKASCLIKIDDGGTLGKTVVNIYTTRKNN